MEIQNRLKKLSERRREDRAENCHLRDRLRGLLEEEQVRNEYWEAKLKGRDRQIEFLEAKYERLLLSGKGDDNQVKKDIAIFLFFLL